MSVCTTCAGTGWVCAYNGQPATGECCDHPSGCPSSNGCPDCTVPGECGGRGIVGERRKEASDG